MITQPSCGITELNVSWNQICHSGATAIGAALRTNTALRTLNLAMNRCGDDGGEQFAAAMEVNTTLAELDLTRNAFGGRTAVAFGFFLLKNGSLKRLLLQDNSLGAIGTRALLKAVASGSSCEIQMSVHDVETSKHAGQKVIFDYMMSSLSSPFELKVGGSPYDFAVASLLSDAALIYKRCALSGLVFIDDRPPKKPKKVVLLVDAETKTIVESATRKPWKVQRYGVFCAEAHFIPPPMPNHSSVYLEEATFLGLIQIIKRVFSSREVAILLDLVLNDLYLTVDQASFSISQLKGTISPVDIVGRLWPCLIDGDQVFEFMQINLTSLEQRRLVDVFGACTIQFTVLNPTGHWVLDLSDCRNEN
ncbi:Leucine-rich repeat-containing protein, partial [Globisporangium splendens]